MKPIFSRGPSLQLRIIIAIVVAIALVAFDRQFDTFNKIRSYLDTAVSPFIFWQMARENCLIIFQIHWREEINFF